MLQRRTATHRSGSSFGKTRLCSTPGFPKTLTGMRFAHALGRMRFAHAQRAKAKRLRSARGRARRAQEIRQSPVVGKQGPQCWTHRTGSPTACALVSPDTSFGKPSYGTSCHAHGSVLAPHERPAFGGGCKISDKLLVTNSSFKH